MDFLEFPDGFKALVIRRRIFFVFVDPKTLKQQIINDSSINDIKADWLLTWPKSS